MTPANYEKMDHLCTNYLSIDDDFVKDVYIRHFCVMIEYYNLCNANDVLTNKKFVYESVLGMDTENIMLAKIISLFDISDDHFDHNLEYVHIVDDIRLIKDRHKKYILLQDFLNYINDLF